MKRLRIPNSNRMAFLLEIDKQPMTKKLIKIAKKEYITPQHPMRLCVVSFTLPVFHKPYRNQSCLCFGSLLKLSSHFLSFLVLWCSGSVSSFCALYLPSTCSAVFSTSFRVQWANVDNTYGQRHQSQVTRCIKHCIWYMCRVKAFCIRFKCQYSLNCYMFSYWEQILNNML